MDKDTREFYIKRLKQDWKIPNPELVYDAYGSQWIAEAMLRADYQRQRSPEGIRDLEAYFMKTLKGNGWQQSKTASAGDIVRPDSDDERSDEFLEQVRKAQRERGA